MEAFAYAFQKCGFMLTEANMHLMTEEQIDEWEDALDEWIADNAY